MHLFHGAILLLATLVVAGILPEPLSASAMAVRQDNTATQSRTISCLEYSTIANLSTISSNSSYRTAYMQKAPVGTLFTARMLNAAQQRLPALTQDTALNRQCGNLTTVAVAEAANNYTKGLVAEYTTAELPVGIRAGPLVVVIVGVIATLLSMVWTFG